MAKFFSNFPVIAYDITGKQLSSYQVPTNIFFRLHFIREALGNIAAYYEYVIKDGDLPDTLAENIYGNPEAHWIILMANDIVDIHYDWPLDSRSFKKYIIGKYGSLTNARTTIHHYEKVIKREESASGTITETRFEVNQSNVASVLDSSTSSLPYDTYNSLPETQLSETFNMGDGKTVVQTTYRDAISIYDWEVAQNEEKRFIKIIKPEYYSQIISEFQKLTDFKQSPYLRKLT